MIEDIIKEIRNFVKKLKFVFYIFIGTLISFILLVVILMLLIFL